MVAVAVEVAAARAEVSAPATEAATTGVAATVAAAIGQQPWEQQPRSSSHGREQQL
jgi:hypothetical protein